MQSENSEALAAPTVLATPPLIGDCVEKWPSQCSKNSPSSDAGDVLLFELAVQTHYTEVGGLWWTDWPPTQFSEQNHTICTKAV